MSPRRNRPRRARRHAADEDRPPTPDIVVTGPPGWQVRVVHPDRALKEYVCPGCNQQVRPGTTHVVAWQPGRDEDRRHWHAGCWQTFVRGGAR